MKKLIIIITLFLSYNTYAQYTPKAGNKLNVKPNGILVPTSTTDDTPIARAELFDTGLSVLKPSTLPTASASVLGVVRVGTGLAIDGSGILSATGGGGTSYTAGNGLSLTGMVFSADTSIVATNANTLSLAETFARFGSGNFFTNSTYFINGGTNNTTDVFSLNPTFIASKQDVLVSGTNIKTLGGTTLLGSGDYGIISSTYGGTGVNNGGRLLTYAGAFTQAGAFATTLTSTATTNATLPAGTNTLYSTLASSITSAQLLSSVSNETGTGVLVFGTSPTITTPNLTYAIANKTTTYTVALTDYTLTGDATTASFVMTLPTAASSTGKIFSFKKIDSSANTVTIKGNGTELIDGTNTKVITTQYGGFTLQSNGTVWYVIL